MDQRCSCAQIVMVRREEADDVADLGRMVFNIGNISPQLLDDLSSVYLRLRGIQ